MSSGSELDDELLQVAGQRKKGGSSAAAAKRKRAKQATSDSDEDVSLDEESDWDDADRNKKPRKTAKVRASAAGPAGGDIGAIDPEDLIIDEEDRKRLEAMTELEREMEINNRVDRRQQELQRMQLLAAAAGDGDAAQKGRKSRGAAPRRSGREIREETAKKSAIEELKAARERKARGQKAHESDEEGVSISEGEDGVDRDALGDYDEDEDVGPRRWEPRDEVYDEEAAQEAAYDDAKTIQVRRHRLEEWFTKPFFAETLPGCMVRLAMGAPPAPDGRPGPLKYMVARVVGVEERETGHHKYNPGVGPWKTPYSFGPDSIKTSYWLKVVRGKSERHWPLAQVSNSGFTDAEWNSWHTACENEKRRQVTRGEVDEVRSRLEAAEKYVYTSEDVTRLLEERRLKGQGPRNFAIERARLERERDGAAEAGDFERLAAAEAELEELTATSAAAAVARRGVGASMAQINKKNADRNFKVALKGEGAAANGDDAATAGMDPFSRRVTRPRIYWNTQRQDAGGEGDDKEGEAAAAAAEEAAAAVLPAVTVAPVETTVVDLSGLDLSLLDDAPRMDPLARRLLGRGVGVVGAGARAAVAGRPTVSLAQYKQRQQGAY